MDILDAELFRTIDLFQDNGLVDCIIKTNQKGFKNVGCEGGQGAFV